LHDLVLEIADKSVAHCVDGSEENFTYVLVGPAENGTIPLNVSVFSGNISHHNKVDAVAFERLALSVKAIVRAQAEQVAAEVLHRLEAAGQAGLAALPEISRAITEEGEARTERYRRSMKASKGNGSPSGS
jgi:hypothetical protein